MFDGMATLVMAVTVRILDRFSRPVDTSFGLYWFHVGLACLLVLQKMSWVNYKSRTLDRLIQVNIRLISLYWFGS